MQHLDLIHQIYRIRGQKVMLDADLAIIYGVTTKALNQAVKRNEDRFPADFMFRLTTSEWKSLKDYLTNDDENGEVTEDLRSQNVTSSETGEEAPPKVNWGGRRYPPNAFTEHGAIMLAGVLRSERAVNASIQVVRAFVRMRTMLANQEELAFRLQQLESVVEGNFGVVFEAIEELMNAKKEERRMIGFKPEEK